MAKSIFLIGILSVAVAYCSGGGGGSSSGGSDEEVVSSADDASAGSKLSYDSELFGDIELSIQEGESLLDTNLASALQIDGTLTAAGPSVNVSATDDLSDEMVGSMTLEIPLSDDAGLVQSDSSVFVGFLVVLPDGSRIYGFVPPDQLETVDNVISVTLDKVGGIGNFQPLTTDGTLPDETTATTDDEVHTKTVADTVLTLKSSTREDEDRIDSSEKITLVFDGAVDVDNITIVSDLGTGSVASVSKTSVKHDTVTIKPSSAWEGTSKTIKITVLPEDGGSELTVSLTLTVAACDSNGGVKVSGSDACWFEGASTSESCATMCSTNSLTYDSATKSFAGSDGTDDQCQLIVETIQGSSYTASGVSSGIYGLGCHHDGSSIFGRITSPETNSDDVGSYIRICACE